MTRAEVALLRLERKERAARLKAARRASADAEVPSIRFAREGRMRGRYVQLIEARVALVRAAKRALEAAEKAPFLTEEELAEVLPE